MNPQSQASEATNNGADKSSYPNNPSETEPSTDEKFPKNFNSRVKFKVRHKVEAKTHQITYTGIGQVHARNRIVLVSVILAALAFYAGTNTGSHNYIAHSRVFLICNHVALFCSLFNVIILTAVVPTAKGQKAFATIFPVTTGVAAVSTTVAYVAATWDLWPGGATTAVHGGLTIGFYVVFGAFSFVLGVIFNAQVKKLKGLILGRNESPRAEGPQTDASDVELEKVVTA